MSDREQISTIQVPGAWIVERGRAHLSVYPWVNSVCLLWVTEAGQRVEFVAQIHAIRCGNLAHPLGAWWKVDKTIVAPIPMCPRCLEAQRKEAETCWSDEALEEWRMHREYAEKMWTDLKGIV